MLNNQNNQVDTDQYLSECDLKDVISFKNEQWASISKFKNIIIRALVNSGISSMVKYIADDSDFKNTNRWFYQGEECEILRSGSKGWQKGKIKINVTLNFIPDEPEDKSPLDDVRQKLERDNP